MLGDFAMRAEYPDPTDDKPQVVISNADIYRTEGNDIYETLRGTQPYYFDGPEKYAKEDGGIRVWRVWIGDPCERTHNR